MVLCGALPLVISFSGSVTFWNSQALALYFLWIDAPLIPRSHILWSPMWHVPFRPDAWLCFCRVSHRPAESPWSLFWFHKPGLAVSPVSVWYSDSITSTVLLGNAIMMIAFTARALPPVHTCLYHLFRTPTTAALVPWPCPIEMLCYILDCGS